jgi:hypothetical protein
LDDRAGARQGKDIHRAGEINQNMGQTIQSAAAKDAKDVSGGWRAAMNAPSARR